MLVQRVGCRSHSVRTSSKQMRTSTARSHECVGPETVQLRVSWTRISRSRPRQETESTVLASQPGWPGCKQDPLRSCNTHLGAGRKAARKVSRSSCSQIRPQRRWDRWGSPLSPALDRTSRRAQVDHDLCASGQTHQQVRRRCKGSP